VEKLKGASQTPFRRYPFDPPAQRD